MKKLFCVVMAAFSMQFSNAQVQYSIQNIDVQNGFLFPSNPREINSFSFKAAVPIENNGDWAATHVAFSYDGKIFPQFSYGGKAYIIDGSELIVKDTGYGYLYKNSLGIWNYEKGTYKAGGIEIDGRFFNNKSVDDLIAKLGEFTDQKILSGKTYRYTFGILGDQQMLIIYGGEKK